MLVNAPFDRSGIVLTLATVVLLAAGCAAAPDVRQDRDQTLDLHPYRTFAF
jgi:hypothetical protein